ncbi:MAG TPA: AmmeMemoRadiSam system protein B [Bacteroidetes bacterium]|nr:hypothetical protein BMS3Bbin04_00481 [bacterium BMS3Bbin04]HDO65126.1 AmmeMemoRadiSam system protein B [Bacteroidota bacterium]HEX04251.1 AmmeMemoRadiSam system protein B [Bacteroidota bacterium]
MTAESPIPALRAVETIPVKQDGEDYIVLRDPLGFSDSLIAVAMGALPILANLDGQLNAVEISEIVERNHALKVEPTQILSMAEMLENASLLHSDSFLQHRTEIEEKYRQETIRESIMAGSGYPDNPADLTAVLRLYEESAPPQDFAPAKPLANKRLLGMLAPHIDYQRGGKSYGRLYKQLSTMLPPAEDGPLLVAIIGVAHNGAVEPVVACAKDFRTPFGLMKYDRQAVKVLREHLGESVFHEEYVHKSEHSVEIQIPWLQHLLKDREVTILPLLAGLLDSTSNGNTPHNIDGVDKALAALRSVEKAHDGPVLWLASVDFAHIGPSFGDPDKISDKDCSAVERRDMKALDYIQNADAEGWWKELMSDGNARRVCGINATYLALSMLKGRKGRILDYQQALSEDRLTMVSHAAAVFQEA